MKNIPCDAKLNKSDWYIWKAIELADELDWFLLYKNTHPLKLSEEQKAQLLLVNRAKDLKWIWIYTDSWILIAFDKTYFILKQYIIDYSKQKDFMWLFRMLYWDTPEWIAKFKELQEELRSRVDSFFHLIENSKTKETVQEYFFRLIRLVRDNEYNDAKLFLALFPSHRDAIKYAWPFKKLFKVDFTNPTDFYRLKHFLAQKSGIYENIPEMRIWKRNEWQTYTSHTYYSALPEKIKEHYFEEKFYLPKWLEVTDLKEWKVLWEWSYIYVTNEDFLKFSLKDQRELYKAIYEDYKSINPENAKELEKEIMSTLRKFWLIHWWWTFISAFEAINKTITNPIAYSAVMVTYQFPTWFLALLALNSFLHLPRYIANKVKWFKFSWDFWDFCKKLWIYANDVKFWEILKRWRHKDEIWNSFLYIALWIKRQMTALAEAQFFNIADTAMKKSYKRFLAEEYILARYPRISDWNEFVWLLSLKTKEERAKEIEKLVKYIDDKMYIRYNNSIDASRTVGWWLIIPKEIDTKLWFSIKLGNNTRDFAQEVANFWHNMRLFYRRYMASYNRNVFRTVKKWWKWDAQKNVRELFEQYYWWWKSREEVSDMLDEAFWNNQDLEFLLNTAIYSALLANMVFKNDIHWNGYDEDYVDWAVFFSEYFDLYKLFFFPIEAWEKTTLWIILTSTFEAASLDLSLEDNANLIWTYNYKAITKQFFKSHWLLRWFAKVVSDMSNNRKYEWAWLSLSEWWERARAELTSSINSFWYYLKDDVERSWFEEYTPKTQTPRLKEIFWIRDYSLKMFDEINKKWSILEVWDWEDWFTNYAFYNTPFLSEIKIWEYSHQDKFIHAIKQLNQSQIYHDIISWKLPEDITDEEYYVLYNMMTQFNPSNLDDIWPTFLVDWSWEDEETWETLHNYNKEAVEKIWHDLMIDNVDKNLLREAVRLLTTAEENYQWQALSALMYLEAQTPWAWQKVLWYIANYELMQNVFFSGKYWYFKKQEDWTYSLVDEIRKNEAMRQESINLAKKYFDYEYILDKEIWAQWALKIFKDRPELEISNFIKDTNKNWTAKLWLYTQPLDVLEQRLEDKNIEKITTSNEAMEVFLLQLYSAIAAAEWNPDWFKMNNFVSKLLSTTWRKWEDWKLTSEWAESLLYSMNSALEMLNNMWISDVEKLVMTAWIFIPHDQILSKAMEWKTDEEINNDPAIQYALRFLRWAAQDVDIIWDRAISETVQKEQTWTDPSDISLSWVTKSKWKNKNWYSNWKSYYNKHTYLYDQIQYMTSKYHKYYNYLYTPKPTNAWSYYSKRERDAKAFWPWLATIKSSWSRKRRDYKKWEPGWNTTQNRWKARPFTNWWDLDKIPDRRTKPKNRRTRSFAVGSKLWNKLIPWRRRYIKARQRDIPTIT